MLRSSNPAIQELHFQMLPLFALVLVLSSVSANHQGNCTSPGCADLCNFNGRWVHDPNECVCDDMWYTPSIEAPHHDNELSHGNVNINCTQRRKSQLTAFTLNLFAPFGAPFTYLELNGHATAYIILFWLGGILAWLSSILPKPHPVVKIAFYLPFASWVFWFLLNFILFGVNHYPDANGEALYEW